MSTTTVSDVFLSYAQSDTAWAAVVQQKLGEAGFKVFTVAGVPSGDNASDLIWDALTESAALIALVRGPGGMSKSLAVEIGAAMAWQKPVYVLYEVTSLRNCRSTPSGLECSARRTSKS